MVCCLLTAPLNHELTIHPVGTRQKAAQVAYNKYILGNILFACTVSRLMIKPRRKLSILIPSQIDLVEHLELRNGNYTTKNISLFNINSPRASLLSKT